MDEIAAPAILPITENPTTTKIDKMETIKTKTNTEPQTSSTNMITSSKTLKRCLSVPIIRNLTSAATTSRGGGGGRLLSTVTTRSATAAANTALKNEILNNANDTAATADSLLTPKKDQQTNNSGVNNNNPPIFLNSMHIGIPRSNPSSREVSPAPMFNIFAPRARRYSASYSPMGAATANSAANGTPLCLTPRVSQLRQEECLDMNSREVIHEREVHTAMQMSQSWEDLTLVAENWSCKSDEFSNPLQVILPTTSNTSCSSPSPTSTRAGLRLPYGLSPSPTRRTFATRRSMSPIAMRPSQLGAVKRKFEMEEVTQSGTQGNWNVYSPPPLKKIFTESRGSSPSSVCPSPDSGTYDGRITPKLFISKLCTSNASSNGSTTSSCSSASSISSSSSGISSGGGSEPMICGSSIDEGISGSESEEKLSQGMITPIHGGASGSLVQTLCSSTDMQDDTTLMDEKSETSSIGGCSSISIESSSWDCNARPSANFLSQLATSPLVNEEPPVVSSSTLSHKNFFINKPVGVSGTKKYIVNHDNIPNNSNNNSNCSEPSTTEGIGIISSSSNNTLLNIVPQLDVSDISSSSNSSNTLANNAMITGDVV